MTDAPALRLRVSLRNHRLVRAREDLELSQAEAGRRIGVSGLNGLETLRESPWGAEGWTPTARRIAAWYGLSCEYLFPDVLRRVKQRTVERALSAGAVEHFLSAHQQQLLTAGDDGDLAERIDVASAFAALPERDRRVLTRRYRDEWTLDEVAEEDGVQQERIRQVEARALRRLRRAVVPMEKP